MKRDYPDRPFVGVGVVVLKGDHVLLIRRKKPPRMDEWSLPGGAQDLGENIRDAAVREVREETGIEIQNLQLLDVVDFIDRDDKQDVRHHYSLIDFSAEYASGEAKGNDDAIEAKWVPFNDLERYNLWQKTIEIIRKAKSDHNSASLHA